MVGRRDGRSGGRSDGRTSSLRCHRRAVRCGPLREVLARRWRAENAPGKDGPVLRGVMDRTTIVLFLLWTERTSNLIRLLVRSVQSKNSTMVVRSITPRSTGPSFPGAFSARQRLASTSRSGPHLTARRWHRRLLVRPSDRPPDLPSRLPTTACLTQAKMRDQVRNIRTVCASCHD